MQQIEQWLRASMGLDAASIGSTSIHRTVRLRMKAARIAAVEDYERMLQESAAEWEQLIEAVVITETWFYRDPQAFKALAGILLMDWLPANPAGRARILSLPCSSGEEPYSIVMALLDAGIPAGRFTVEGVDLSQCALEKAAAGRYGKNSFRGADLSFRDRHFSHSGDAFQINPKVRDSVNFLRANLLNDVVPLGQARYDFIFCRNLLIYFDRATQRQAFAKLGSLLARGGTLFVGPAEVPLALENGFAAVNLPMAFACRRASEMPAAHRLAPPLRAPAKPLLKPAPPVAIGLPRPARPAKSAPEAVDQLAAARDLADGGKLAEAAQLCNAHLDRHGASVHAFYLLGVIHDAQGDPQAREFYRKALYLDPNHYESLLQMALLTEKDGDSGAARNFRRRAQKLHRPS
jgi:chemotaxis protein methyltransferase WspC